jgi:MraZ protein
MFIGEFKHNIDEKGRLQLPAKWRFELAQGAVLTKGFDSSLKLYPIEEWGKIAAKLATLPQSRAASRAYVRQTLAGAVDVQLDKSGRIVLPTFLRQFANLQKQAVLAGLHDHLEIWDEQTWEKYLSNIDAGSTDFEQTLKEIGI